MALSFEPEKHLQKSNVVDIAGKRKKSETVADVEAKQRSSHTREVGNMRQQEMVAYRRSLRDELPNIDEAADKIIKQFGLIPEIRQKAEMMREHIDKDFIKGDVDLVKVKLLHWGESSERPELYLGLAEWWKNHRKLENPTPIEG